ncbi:unnamed protein product [Cylindrotheca closterium]|uniref:Uncharacterized protein n=1 Tax=Cylindrotheca closterium TaxID=2856 RepID=A0AAD2G6K6_9STRA|nr:unnamed protein product [Cylindrotheca closterium]
MGQGASTPKQRRKKKKSKKSNNNKTDNNNHDQDDLSLLKLEQKIALTKENLIRTKQLGGVNKRTQEDEIYYFEMELYKKKYILHKRGHDAKQYLSFWEYVEIVNTVLHADSTDYSVASGDMTLEQHKAAQEQEKEKRKAAAGTLAKHNGHFNVYSFFEAFLLRRLHIAMILKHQRAKQSDVWNDVIMSLYNIMPGMKKRNKAANEKLIVIKPESNETMREMIKLQKKKVKLYEHMVENLKAEIEEEEMANSLDPDDPLVVDADEPPPSTIGGEDEDVNTAKYYQNNGRRGLDDDEMSFKSFTSRKSSRSKRRTSKNPTAANGVEQAPRWKKSSRSKLSKASNRDVTNGGEALDSSYRSANSSRRRSPSPAYNSPMASPMKSPNQEPSPAAGGGGADGNDKAPITDDDIERFLYPNKPLRKSGGSSRRNIKNRGGEQSLLPPSELEFVDQDGGGRSIVSGLHDDSSVGSGSNAPQSLADIKAKKKELDGLIKAMETPGEEGESANSS